MEIPALTAVSFDYKISTGFDNASFVLDLSLKPTSVWLADPGRDFNAFFQYLQALPSLASASVTTSWNDGFRVTLPFPEKSSDIKLQTIAQLIEQVGKVMTLLPNYSTMAPQANAMLNLVERVCRVATPT